MVIESAEYDKYIAMLRLFHAKGNESLAEFYFRTNRQLLGTINLSEFDPRIEDICVVGANI